MTVLPASSAKPLELVTRQETIWLQDTWYRLQQEIQIIDPGIVSTTEQIDGS